MPMVMDSSGYWRWENPARRKDARALSKGLRNLRAPGAAIGRRLLGPLSAAWPSELDTNKESFIPSNSMGPWPLTPSQMLQEEGGYSSPLGSAPLGRLGNTYQQNVLDTPTRQKIDADMRVINENLMSEYPSIADRSLAQRYDKGAVDWGQRKGRLNPATGIFEDAGKRSSWEGTFPLDIATAAGIGFYPLFNAMRPEVSPDNSDLSAPEIDERLGYERLADTVLGWLPGAYGAGYGPRATTNPGGGLTAPQIADDIDYSGPVGGLKAFARRPHTVGQQILAQYGKAPPVGYDAPRDIAIALAPHINSDKQTQRLALADAVISGDITEDEAHQWGSLINHMNPGIGNNRITFEEHSRLPPNLGPEVMNPIPASYSESVLSPSLIEGVPLNISTNVDFTTDQPSVNLSGQPSDWGSFLGISVPNITRPTPGIDEAIINEAATLGSRAEPDYDLVSSGQRASHPGQAGHIPGMAGTLTTPQAIGVAAAGKPAFNYQDMISMVTTPEVEQQLAGERATQRAIDAVEASGLTGQYLDAAREQALAQAESDPWGNVEKFSGAIIGEQQEAKAEADRQAVIAQQMEAEQAARIAQERAAIQAAAQASAAPRTDPFAGTAGAGWDPSGSGFYAGSAHVSAPAASTPKKSSKPKKKTAKKTTKKTTKAQPSAADLARWMDSAAYQMGGQAFPGGGTTYGGLGMAPDGGDTGYQGSYSGMGGFERAR